MAFGAVSLKSHTAKNSCTYGHCDVLMLAIEILNYIGAKKTFSYSQAVTEEPICLGPEGTTRYKSH